MAALSGAFSGHELRPAVESTSLPLLPAPPIALSSPLLSDSGPSLPGPICKQPSSPHSIHLSPSSPSLHTLLFPIKPLAPSSLHSLSSWPRHLQQDGGGGVRGEPLMGLMVIPHPSSPLLPPLNRHRFPPTKGRRQRLCETSCSHAPFPLPSAG